MFLQFPVIQFPDIKWAGHVVRKSVQHCAHRLLMCNSGQLKAADKKWMHLAQYRILTGLKRVCSAMDGSILKKYR